MEKKPQRPTMITVIGVLNLVCGSFLMLLGVFGASQGAEGAALFGAGVLSLGLSIALLQLRPWARKVAIGVYLVRLVIGVAGINLLLIGISSLILAYLCSNKVKEA